MPAPALERIGRLWHESGMGASEKNASPPGKGVKIRVYKFLLLNLRALCDLRGERKER
jgi:hypothetical protein